MYQVDRLASPSQYHWDRSNHADKLFLQLIDHLGERNNTKFENLMESKVQYKGISQIAKF
jgi:hypothetical protein